MAVEFSAERLLAPFFGSSEMVWGSLIGLILLALSVGYFFGGKVADKNPRLVVLGGLVLGCGVFVALLPTMAEPLLASLVKGLLATPTGVVLTALAGTLLLFVPPVTALGMVSPYAVRLSLRSREESGRDVGALYAWSTLGSLIGTFIPVFWTIPSFGVRATLWISAAVLIGLGVTAMGGRYRALAVLILVPWLGSVVASPLLKPLPGLITEVETPYQFAAVYQEGSTRVLSVNDGAGFQSVYTPKALTGLYYDAFLTLPFILPGGHAPVSALLIGMGAGTIPTLYQRDVDPHRRVRMVGVEIDPALTRLGKQYFHLSPNAASIVHADGRVYLETTGRRFDLLMVDAYSNEIYIPFPLTTTQFFNLCQRHLTPDGLLALNVNATSAKAPLLGDIERTLESVFPYVEVARAPGAYNYLLVAGMHPIPAPTPQSVPPLLGPVAAKLSANWHRPNPGKGLLLTDNRAPIDNLVNRMILNRLMASFHPG